MNIQRHIGIAKGIFQKLSQVLINKKQRNGYYTALYYQAFYRAINTGQFSHRWKKTWSNRDVFLWTDDGNKMDGSNKEILRKSETKKMLTLKIRKRYNEERGIDEFNTGHTEGKRAIR